MIQVKGEGTLLFDGFGNLEMEIRTDETTRQVLSEAGIPFEKGRLSVKGRTAVDMAHPTLTFVPQGQPLIVPPSGPLAAIHPPALDRRRRRAHAGHERRLGQPDHGRPLAQAGALTGY